MIDTISSTLSANILLSWPSAQICSLVLEPPGRVRSLIYTCIGERCACDILHCRLFGYLMYEDDGGAFSMAIAHVTEDEKALIEAIRELALERVAPRAAEIDHTGEFPWDLKELLAQQDILAMPFPTEYGGIGASELAVVMAIEELSRHCATTALILAVQQLGAMPILLAGNEGQKSKYLPPLASGEWLAAFGLTESASGSDAGAMQTMAVR